MLVHFIPNGQIALKGLMLNMPPQGAVLLIMVSLPLACRLFDVFLVLIVIIYCFFFCYQCCWWI